LAGYTEHWKTDKELKIHGIERDFRVEIGGVEVSGTFDAIVSHPQRGLWVLEHKTTGSASISLGDGGSSQGVYSWQVSWRIAENAERTSYR
jgi:hypothetical protein